MICVLYIVFVCVCVSGVNKKKELTAYDEVCDTHTHQCVRYEAQEEGRLIVGILVVCSSVVL